MEDEKKLASREVWRYTEGSRLSGVHLGRRNRGVTVRCLRMYVTPIMYYDTGENDRGTIIYPMYLYLYHIIHTPSTPTMYLCTCKFSLAAHRPAAM